MSSIHKLGIIGIRSYSPENEEIIKFFKPLTLILGKNGAGKTTIIEALKMAVCGSLPPNSQSGKTFICDPKLVNRPEVKAKIEIAFTAINQRKILGVRTFQLTHTDKKTEFRQVDQILKAKDLNGDIISVTNKCAEMDRQIPELLGVSQAVLDNVIFCHQEESLWPFGDTAKLKSIFDELFDTTSYTNLLENLKKIKKEYKKAAKDTLTEFQLEKKDFDQLLRTNKSLLGEMEKIGELQRDIEQYHNRIRALKERLRPEEERGDVERNINIVKYKISELEKKRNELLEMFETMDAQIFTENTIQELIQCKEDLVKSYSKKENEIKNIENKLEQLRQEKDTVQRQLDQVNNADRDSSEVTIKLKDCRDKILGLITINLIGNETDERYYEKILNEAEKQLIALTKEMENDKKKFDEQENNIQTRLDNTKAELATKWGAVNGSERELSTIEQKMSLLTKELNELTKRTRNKPRNIDQSIEEINQKLENLRETRRLINDSMNNKNKELIDLSGQLNENTKNKDILLKKQDLDSLQGKLTSVNQEYQSLEILDEMWMLSHSLSEISDVKFQAQEDVSDLMDAINSYERRLKMDKEAAITKRDKINDHLKEINSFIQIKTTELKAKQKEIKEFVKKMESGQLQSLLDQDSDFATQYQHIKDKLKQVEKRELAMQYTEDIMMKMFEKSQKSGKCAICTRKLEETEIQRIGAKCQEIISKSNSFTSSEQKTLDELKHQKALFKSLKNEYEEFRKNKQIIAQLEKDIQNKEKEKTISQQQFNTLKANVDNLTSIEELIAQIRGISEKLDKLNAEKEELTSKINNMKRLYPALQDPKNIKTVVYDEKKLEDRINIIKKEVAAAQDKLNDLDSQIAAQELQKEELDNIRDVSKKDFDELDRKTKELEELKAKKNEHEFILKKSREEIERLTETNDELEEKRKELRNKRKPIEDKQAITTSRLKELIQEFKNLKELWQRAQNKKTKRAENDALKEKLSAEIQRLSDEIAHLNNQLQKLKDNVKDKDQHLKLIEDNITLKTYEQDLEKLRNEHERLTQSIKEYIENEKYNRNIKAEIEKETAKLNQCDGKYSVLINNYEKTLGEVRGKWSSSEKAYVEKLFKANINEYVVQDLDIYITNLEKALMLFHKQKMEEINKIIADLWIKTYQGSDIKKIEIKSDVEPTNTRNKSFNYRIVYYNADGKELDMKGRCSMGQKVIASIVIRLALAEAFCTNCGILALDEPTTNLDKEHIKKLAKELANLIEERINNENFQLIIITHDKEFLRELREYADEYYKVYKDSNNFSRIERNRTSAL